MKRSIANLRWYIAGLLCLSTLSNYLDRQTLSVLAETIQRELNLSTLDYSFITSSFLASYTIMYAVGGRLVDRFGTRRGFTIFVSGWSVANMLHAIANSAHQLAFFRFLLGAAEPANFPAGIKAVSEWFPMRERALAVGVFNAGTAIGAAVAVPFVSWIALTWNWRGAFLVTGALGFIWVGGWLAFYRLPREHPRLSSAERELILGECAAEENQDGGHVPIGRLLGLRATWGCILARMLTDPVSYFLIFWIPKYLQQEHGFNLADIGRYAWIPFIALAAGNLAGGGVPRFLTARGWSVNRARKTVMFAASCLMPCFCLMITRAQSSSVAVACITGLMFCHSSWGNIILPAEVFPTRVVGTVSGFGGALGGVMGIITQLSIGWVVQNFSFAPIFTAISSVYLLAFVLVCWLIGDLGIIRGTECAAP